MTTTRTLTIPGDEWEAVRKRVVPHAAGPNESKPVLAAVRLEVRDGVRRWAATDSYTAARLEGGRTQAADASVLLPVWLFSPAKPTPSKVIVTWNRVSVSVLAPGWDRARSAEPVEGDYPNLDEIFDRYRVDGFTVAFDAPIPKSNHGFGALPFMAAGTTLWVRNGSWERVGESYGTSLVPRLFAVNDKLLRRMVRTVGPTATVSSPERALRFDDWPGDGMVSVEGLLMPMAADSDDFLGEGWAA